MDDRQHDSGGFKAEQQHRGSSNEPVGAGLDANGATVGRTESRRQAA